MSGPQRWSVRAWRSVPVLGRDAVVAVLVALATFLPGLRHNGVDLAELPPRALDAAGVVLALGQALPLVVRRRAPAVCLALVAASFGVYQARGSASLFAGVGVLLALYSCGAHLRRRRRWVVLVASAVYVLLAGALHAVGSPERVGDFAGFWVVLAASWAAGAWVRARAAAEGERRSDARAAAVQQERARIARELHDVVTHHVTAVVVQAEAATLQVAQPDARAGVAAALEAIASTGRAALDDLRHQLGVLDPQHPTGDAVRPGRPPGRAPAAAGLQDLVDRAAAAGQPVRLREVGPRRDLGDSTALALRRVVQEGLTNALKHARGASTDVLVRHGADAVEVEVTTAAAVSDLPARTLAAGSSRGLVGLHERVTLLGGHLQAGARADGTFTLRAHLPTTTSAPAAGESAC